MNRKKYERLGSHSAPLSRWEFIFVFRLISTILEIAIFWLIVKAPPEIFLLMPDYGKDLENNLIFLFVISFFVNVACLTMYRTVRFRSTWRNNGITYKHFIIWFSYQTSFVVLLFAFHCFVYNSLETTFEFTEFMSIFKFYKEDDTTRRTVNQVQINFRCCGVNSPHDWSDMQWWMEGIGLEDYRFKVPKSCCSEKFCTYASQIYEQLTIRQRGCYNVLMDELESKMYSSCVLLGILSLLHIPQLVLIFGSLPDMKKINLTFDEFVISKRLFTVLYQKNMMAKMNREMADFNSPERKENLENEFKVNEKII